MTRIGRGSVVGWEKAVLAIPKALVSQDKLVSTIILGHKAPLPGLADARLMSHGTPVVEFLPCNTAISFHWSGTKTVSRITAMVNGSSNGA
jgi:hypothetical protein